MSHAVLNQILVTVSIMYSSSSIEDMAIYGAEVGYMKTGNIPDS